MKNNQAFFILMIFLLMQGMLACRKDQMGQDPIDLTAKVDSIKVNAGREIVISAPRDYIFLDASETVMANPGVKEIQFSWRCLSYPQGATLPKILKPNEMLTEVEGLKVGKYLFELDIKVKEIKQSNVVHVTVNPDLLVGKTIVYESVWKSSKIEPDINFVGFTAQVISDDLLGRDKNKINIEYWNELLSRWKPITIFSMYSREGRIKFELPWWDFPEYYIGVKDDQMVQVRVTFN